MPTYPEIQKKQGRVKLELPPGLKAQVYAVCPHCNNKFLVWVIVKQVNVSVASPIIDKSGGLNYQS